MYVRDLNSNHSKSILITRIDLEEMINKAKLLRKEKSLLNQTFYDYDKYSMEIVQSKKNILISEVSRFIPEEFIIYTGRVTKDNQITDTPAEVIIMDLNNRGSARFAYACYKLTEQNKKRYPNLTIRSEKMSPNIYPTLDSEELEKLDQYFAAKLSKYFDKV